MQELEITPEAASRIYDILIEECQAHPNERCHFVQVAPTTPEYRFGGGLGHGGKFWNNNGRWYVSCYIENETPIRRAMIDSANQRLAALLEEIQPIRK